MSEAISLPDHIVATEFDGGEGVLVDLDTKRYYQLNETAMLVWRSLERGHSTDQIIDEMTNGYEVTTNHAADSLQKLLKQLQSYKLLRNDKTG